MASVITITATDHLDANGSVVQSGLNLADAVLQAMTPSTQVEVSLTGLRGASSSYFNAFLQRVVQSAGLQAVGSLIRLRFSTKTQELLYGRSLDAVRESQSAT